MPPDPLLPWTRVTITGSDVLFGSNIADNGVVDTGGPWITCDTPPSLLDGPVPIEVKNPTMGNRCASPMPFTHDTPVAPVDCSIDTVFPHSGDMGGAPG